MFSSSYSILALILLPRAIAFDFPATIEIDVVFPLNKTYNIDNNFPLVFATQNAEAAFGFGSDLYWQILALSNVSQTYISVGSTPIISGESDPPPDTTDNIWYWAQNVTFDAGRPSLGLHELSWTWGATECEQDGDDVTVTIGNKQAEGKLYFTIVADGSGQDVNLTSDSCPEFGALITAEDNADWGEYCPIFGRTPNDVKPDPCKAKIPAHIAACAMANVTGSRDRSACERAIELGDGNGGGEGDGNGGGEDDDAAVRLPLSAPLALTASVLAAAFMLI